jgi:hypothetical protein
MEPDRQHGEETHHLPPHDDQTDPWRNKNKDVRRWFYSIADILDTVIKRQLQWIGKVARMDHSQMPQNLLMSWTSHRCPRNQPQNNYRKAYANAIHQIVEECDPLEGIVSTWMHIPQESAPLWTRLINEWYEKVRQVNEPIPTRPVLSRQFPRFPQDPRTAERQTAPPEGRRQ